MPIPTSISASASATTAGTLQGWPCDRTDDAQPRRIVAIAEEKAAGQRLLNVLIVLLLLAALVIITWISLQTPSTPGELADSKDPTLEQLVT